MKRNLRARLIVFAVLGLALAAPAAASAFGPLSSFGSAGAGAGQMSQEGGLAIAPDGSTYVADFGNNRVDVFAADGAFLLAFGKEVNLTQTGDVCTSQSGCRQGVGGTSAGALIGPEAVAIAPDGTVYVSDDGNNRIDVYTPQGTFLRAFGKGVSLDPAGDPDICTTASGCTAGLRNGSAGSMSFPRGLQFGPDGLLYVADTNDNRIDVFTPVGVFVRAFGKAVNSLDGSGVCTGSCQAAPKNDGSAGSMSSPHDVSSGPGGQLAISDRENNRIDIFTAAGVFVRAIGREVDPNAPSAAICTDVCQKAKPDGLAGALNSPSGLAVDRSGNLVIADQGNSRISELGFDGSFIRAFGAGVIDASEAFQVCTAATGCLPGVIPLNPLPGAIFTPFGVALDCQGAIYVAGHSPGVEIVRFGEAGTPPPPCPVARPGPSPTPPRPSHAFRFKLKLNRTRGTATLIVTVPGPGRIAVAGRGIGRVNALARRAGAVDLPIRLAGKAKRRLLEAGRATVSARVTFTPTGGTALTRSRALTLRKTGLPRAAGSGSGPRGSRLINAWVQIGIAGV